MCLPLSVVHAHVSDDRTPPGYSRRTSQDAVRTLARGLPERPACTTRLRAQEANERTVADFSGSEPSQRWFESDADYDTRVRREANELLIERGTESAPNQRFLEGDHEYRSRIAHEAREVRAGGQAARVSDTETSWDSSSSSPSYGSAHPGGQRSSTPATGSSGGFTWLVVLVMVGVGAALGVERRSQPAAPTTPSEAATRLPAAPAPQRLPVLEHGRCGLPRPRCSGHEAVCALHENWGVKRRPSLLSTR